MTQYAPAHDPEGNRSELGFIGVFACMLVGALGGLLLALPLSVARALFISTFPKRAIVPVRP